MGQETSMVGQPTRDFFIPATDGSDRTRNNAFTGFDIDADGEDAWIVFRVPDDFSKLLAFDLVVIGLIADASMTVSVDVNYCQPNEVSNQQVQGPVRFTLTNVGLNQMREVDIRQLLLRGDSNSVKAGDYVAVHVERLAIMSDDTDLFVIGVHFKYK